MKTLNDLIREYESYIYNSQLSLQIGYENATKVEYTIVEETKLLV